MGLDGKCVWRETGMWAKCVEGGSVWPPWGIRFGGPDFAPVLAHRHSFSSSADGSGRVTAPTQRGNGQERRKLGRTAAADWPPLVCEIGRPAALLADARQSDILRAVSRRQLLSLLPEPSLRSTGTSTMAALAVLSGTRTRHLRPSTPNCRPTGGYNQPLSSPFLSAPFVSSRHGPLARALRRPHPHKQLLAVAPVRQVTTASIPRTGRPRLRGSLSHGKPRDAAP